MANIVDQVSLGAIVQVRDRLLDQQAKGRKILRLESGDPSFDIPVHAREAMEKALRDGQTHYTASTGIPVLRQAIHRKVTTENKLEVPGPDNVIVTNGGMNGLYIIFRALLDPGDEVVYSLPPWFLYEPMLLSADAVPVKVRVRPEDNDLDLDAIRSAIGPRTRAVIVNTPNNPTGRIYPPATLRALAALLTDASARWGRPIWLISDEPYSRLVFSDAEFHSPSEFYPYTVISYSYGKVLLTPGERVGWLAISPAIPGREQLRQAIEVCQIAAGWLFPSAVLQYAIGDLERLSIDMADLERKRDWVVAELTAAGYQLRSPEGTFYLWVRSPESDDTAFSHRLAERQVLVLPGTICQAPGYFRVSLTADNEMIDRALPVFRAAVAEVTGTVG